MQVGDMIHLYTHANCNGIFKISMISIMLPRASVSARRINEILIQNQNKRQRRN
ncbi:MAG: hypothetical protein ACLS9A_09235 [Clostridia bacterium]